MWSGDHAFTCVKFLVGTTFLGHTVTYSGPHIGSSYMHDGRIMRGYRVYGKRIVPITPLFGVRAPLPPYFWKSADPRGVLTSFSDFGKSWILRRGILTREPSTNKMFVGNLGRN